MLGGRVPAHHAAWVNSAMCHARDYDDTHDGAILHAGVSSVPAAIAAAQLRGTLSGAELIAAVAAGLEVTCRLGTAIKVDIIETGFIYTSLLGYFGATAAAGRALGLTLDEMASAFGIVYSSVAGNHQVTRDASLMKRLQPGLAAQAAVVAVQLARRGIRGPQGVFEGIDGFFRVYLQGRVSGDDVRADLGTRFELMNLSYKPYPCCRDTHAAVDAVLELRAEARRAADDIESIHVGLTAPGYQMVCVPEHVRLAPRTVVEAQFSIPYTVAAAWIDGKLEIGHFTDEALRRTDVLELASRVTVLRRRRARPRLAALCHPRQGDHSLPRRSDARDAGGLLEGPPAKSDDTAGICGQDRGLCGFRRPAAGCGHRRPPHVYGHSSSSRFDDVATLVHILTPVAEESQC